MTPVETIFVQVIELSVRGGGLIGFALIARVALRRLVPPRFLFAGWLLLAGVLLVPWRLPVPWHPWAATPVAWPQQSAGTARERGESGQGARLMAVPFVEPSSMSVSRVAASRIEPVRFTFLGQRVMMQRSWLRVLVAFWLSGVAGLLLVRVVALQRLARALDRTRQPESAQLVEAVKAEALALGLKKIPEIVVTRLLETPALCGLVRPRLLFPVGFEARVSATELPWVVRHELAHLQRRDTWAQAWMQVACAVHWFNPLVWFAARLAREDGELACDEAVLRRHARNPVARVAYGETLLSVIGSARDAAQLPAAVGIVEGQRQLMKRIVSIAAYRPPTLLSTLAGVALLTGVAGVGATQATSPAVPASPPAVVKTPAPAPIPGLSPDERAKWVERTRAEDKQWEDNLTYELEGIGRVAGVPVALISFSGNLCAVKVGSYLIRHKVESIDVDNKKVVMTRPGQFPLPLVLTLTTQNPIELPKLNDQEVHFLLSKEGSKLWNSDHGIPIDLLKEWGKVSREAQAEVLVGYLRKGFVVGGYVRSGIPGAWSFSSKLLEEEISRRNKARRDAFLASLTPEQRARYNPIQQLIRFTAPVAEREKQVAAGRAAQAAQAEVIAALTPEQQTLYEEWRSWIEVPKPVIR